MDRVSGRAKESTPSIGKALCRSRALRVACLLTLAAGLVGCDLPPYTPEAGRQFTARALGLLQGDCAKMGNLL